MRRELLGVAPHPGGKEIGKTYFTIAGRGHDPTVLSKRHEFTLHCKYSQLDQLSDETAVVLHYKPPLINYIVAMKSLVCLLTDLNLY